MADGLRFYGQINARRLQNIVIERGRFALMKHTGDMTGYEIVNVNGIDAHVGDICKVRYEPDADVMMEVAGATFDMSSDVMGALIVAKVLPSAREMPIAYERYVRA